MRLRIQTVPPLPELKVWYSTDHLTLSDSSIAHLKHAICLQVPALKQFLVHAPHLVLLLDSFELLDDSPLSVLRDGDLICIRILLSALPAPRKRKPALDQDSPRMKKRQKLPSAFIQGRSVQIPEKLMKTSKSGSDSSDDDSDSTDGDSDSTDGDSDSSSSWSSSSSSASLTSPATLGIHQPAKPPLPSAAGFRHAVEPVVPPGFGKPSTQSRNRRRRVKKRYEKEAVRLLATSTPPACISPTNSYPLGTQSKFQKNRDGPAGEVANNDFGMNTEAGTSDAVTDMVIDAVEVVVSQGPSNENMGEVMMSTLRNKNKKKGYKQSMTVPLPRKIVFADSTTPPPSQVQNGATIATSNRVVLDAPVRLVVPSEKQDQGELPPHMFVTSVDVEESMWCQSKTGNRNKSWKALHEWPMRESCPEGSVAHVDAVPHSEPSVLNEGPTGTLDLDWDLVEKQWETFEEINHSEQLRVGGSVAWKGLALDTHTFTPEVLLTVARVIRLPDPITGQQLIVRPFLRPAGSERASSLFELGLRENEDEEHEWNSVISSKWRIINV